MELKMFGTRLRELRKERGITQVELANFLNVTKATVNDWEHNKCQTSFEMLAKIARYFNVTSDYLIGLVDYY